MTTYRVTALKYGHQLYPGPAVLWFDRWFSYVRMDLYLWLVQGDRRTVLVDTGMSEEHAKEVNSAIRAAMGTQGGLIVEEDPLSVLGRHGVTADSVDTVIISHAHIDHVSNVDKFPNAEFVTSEHGFNWISDPPFPDLISPIAVPPHAISFLREARRAGRLRLTRDDEEVLPGVRTIRTGGHTIDHQSVLIDTSKGTVGLAVDNAPMYQNLERDQPVGCPFDLIAAAEAIRSLKQQADILIPGHDPQVTDRHANGRIA